MKYRVSREKYRQESSDRFYRNDCDLTPLIAIIILFGCVGMWVKSAQHLRFDNTSENSQQISTVDRQ